SVWLRMRVRELSPELFDRVLRLLRAEDTAESIALALGLCDEECCRPPSGRPLAEEMAFALLTHNEIFNQRAANLDHFAYSWTKVPYRSVDPYPPGVVDPLFGVSEPPLQPLPHRRGDAVLRQGQGQDLSQVGRVEDGLCPAVVDPVAEQVQLPEAARPRCL